MSRIYDKSEVKGGWDLTLILAATLTLIFIPVASCKKEAPKPAVQKQAEKVKPAPKAPPAAPAEIKKEKKTSEEETYSYNPQGRRDPFLSIIEVTKRQREAAQRKKSLKPAESYDVSEIRVIAIARDKDRYYAMVVLPNKKYFTVKEGMTLGIHGGKVIRIDERGVVVREFLTDYKGEIQPKDTILRLRKEEG